MGKEFILANIAEATRLVTEHPESLLDLDAYKQQKDCGTCYCAAGLLTTSAHFRALGWELHRGDGTMWVHVGGFEIDNTEVEPQFGPNANRTLFSAAGESPFDQSYEGIHDVDIEYSSGAGHKKLALHRLACQRAIVEAM